VFTERSAKRVVGSAPTTFNKVARSISDLKKTESAWFDGSLSSIERRTSRLMSISRQVRQLMSDDTELDKKATLSEWLVQVEAKISNLRDVAAEYVEADYHDAIQQLPSYSVTAAESTHTRLGERYEAGRAPHLTMTSSRSLDRTNWKSFSEVEPRFFVDRNIEAVRSYSEMRERAVDYALEVTSKVEREVMRSQIVESFVDGVELERRKKLNLARKSAKVSQERSSASMPDSILFF
jgi:hypothetical protein